MLFLEDTSLFHFQSNGWALSRSCLHQVDGPVCDKFWLTLHFKASEHTYWLECFNTLYKPTCGVENPDHVAQGFAVVAQLSAIIVTKK